MVPAKKSNAGPKRRWVNWSELSFRRLGLGVLEVERPAVGCARRMLARRDSVRRRDAVAGGEAAADEERSGEGRFPIAGFAPPAGPRFQSESTAHELSGW